MWEDGWLCKSRTQCMSIDSSGLTALNQICDPNGMICWWDSNPHVTSVTLGVVNDLTSPKNLDVWNCQDWTTCKTSKATACLKMWPSYSYRMVWSENEVKQSNLKVKQRKKPVPIPRSSDNDALSSPLACHTDIKGTSLCWNEAHKDVKLTTIITQAHQYLSLWAIKKY